MKNSPLILIIILWVLSTGNILGQKAKKLLKGKVSYQTLQSVYVRFENTEYINVNDTLSNSMDSLGGCKLVVFQKSSRSCVCRRIDDCKLEIDDIMYFTSSQVDYELLANKTVDLRDSIIIENNVQPELDIIPIKPERIQKTRGRISVASNSLFREGSDSKNSLLYRFSVESSNIKSSKFSFETYINYRQNYLTQKTEQPVETKFLRVYSLAINYEVNSNTQLTLGRKINRRASSLGAIDGLQIEKHISNFYIGGIVGFRPDISDFGFNPNLLQYGTYIGSTTDNNNLQTSSTLGLLEQRNNGAIDRRYAFFQHSSNLFSKINIFGSFELDIYNKVNGISKSNARLTNLYLYSNFRLSRKIDISVSYDSRKRIIYYETFKTDIERLLDDDEARQGIRTRISIKPIRNVFVGISYSSRFQTSNINSSNNINANIGLSKIPSLGGSLSISYNENSSNYLKSKIISFRHSRPLFIPELSADFYVRTLSYDYKEREIKNNQQYYGIGLSYRATSQMYIDIFGELNTDRGDKNYRFNARITRRF